MSYALDIRRITSLETSPDLQPYRTLRRPMDHRKMGIFVAEGDKVVRRLLASGLPVVSLLLTEEWLDALRQDQAFSVGPENRGLTCFLAPKKAVETIVGYGLHQGIMAVGKIPPEPSLHEILGHASAPGPHLLVAIDGLVNAENVGVVVRNCAAFGVDALLVGETSSSPYLRRAVRNSMGAVFRMPVIHPPRLSEFLSGLRHARGMRIIAAHPHREATIYAADIAGDVCIVLGNEGEGISEEVLGQCDLHIAIPMMRETDSLNVASASAVFLYEVRRQRQALSTVPRPAEKGGR